MFKPIDLPKTAARATEEIGFSFDGISMSAPRGDTVASALLRNGVTRFRTSVVTGSDRGPFCLMGVCFDCLLTIDGVENQQGCLRVVEEGMQVKTQQGATGTAKTGQDG